MLNLNRRKAAAPARPLPAPTRGQVVAMPVELLTVRQAATFAQVSQPTIRRWIRDEGLRAYRSKERGRVRIDKVDLVNFLKGEAI
jgi:excisionase family DNA binding protein